MNIDVVVVGNGLLARSMRGNPPYDLDVRTLNDTSSDQPSVVIHAGSGRELKRAIRWCVVTRSTLVQASSGIEASLLSELPFPVIDAPNLSIAVAQFTEVLPAIDAALRNAGLAPTLYESHRSSKTTPAATAERIADLVGLPQNASSIRDANEQLDRGVPARWLDQHAYHWLTYQGGLEVTIEIAIKVNGLAAYVSGANRIVREIANKRDRLENRRYTIPELLAL